MAHDNTSQLLRLKTNSPAAGHYLAKSIFEPMGHIIALRLQASSSVRLWSFGAKQANTLPTQSQC